MDLSTQGGRPVAVSQPLPLNVPVGTTGLPTTTSTTATTSMIHKSKHTQSQPNRLQNSVRLLMKQASEFQQQQQLKNQNALTTSNKHITTTTSHGDDPVVIEDSSSNSNVRVLSNSTIEKITEIVPTGIDPAVVVDDSQHPHPPLLLKQAGVALQQQFRGLRRRVKSVRSLQQQQLCKNDIVSSMENSSSHNSESYDAHSTGSLGSPTKSKRAAIVSPTSLNDDDDDRSDTLDVSKLTPKKISTISKNTIKIDLQQQDRSLPSSSSPIVLSHPESLYEAIHTWYDACCDLLTGPDMIRLLHSTGYVYYHGIRFGIQTMTLPITIPVHIGYNVGDMIVRTTLSILPTAINPVSRNSSPLISQHQSSGQVSEEDEHHRHHHNGGGLLGGIFSIPGAILDITGKVVIAIVAPVLGGGCTNDDQRNQQNSQKQSAGASSSPEVNEKAVFYAKTPTRYPSITSATNRHADYLERLRLDYALKDVDQMPRRKLFSVSDIEATKRSSDYTNIPISAPAMQLSEFLLRVNDWGVSRPTDESDLYYIDISRSAMKSNKINNQELVTIALDRFVQGAMLLLSSHPICRIDNGRGGSSTIQQEHAIQWHPEGSTKRLLRERSQAVSPTSDSQGNIFKEEVLIWSGRFQHEIQHGYGRKHGFFLARGGIPMSPDEFVKLLWDNTRTSEYNNFCLGRFTLHGLSCSSTSDDDASFLNGSSKTASKVIQSEMRVPFAGITVKAVCLMHVRPLSTNDGYIICSRSLDAGPSGIHTATSIRQPVDKNNSNIVVTPAKNEILWGVNIIRSLPNHPNATELTSLSQVGSAVPSFLAQKIGLMGIGDFFKNVRQVAEKNINH